MRSSIAGLALLLALSVTGPATAADASVQVPEIIRSSPVFSAPMTFSDVAVTRKRAVQVDVAALQGLAAAGTAPRFILHLFDDARFEAQIVSTDSTADGGTIHVARLVGVPDGQAIFVVNASMVSGNITLPGAFYQVRTVAGGAQIVQQLDPSRFPPDEPFVPAPRFELAPEVAPQAMGDTGATIDVMVAYTATTRAAAGGTAQMLNQINSPSPKRTRPTRTARSCSACASCMQWRWRTPKAGHRDRSRPPDRHERRVYRPGAHASQHIRCRFVSLLVENGGGYCGIAWLMTSVSTSFASNGFRSSRAAARPAITASVTSSAITWARVRHVHGHGDDAVRVRARVRERGGALAHDPRVQRCVHRRGERTARASSISRTRRSPMAVPLWGTRRRQSPGAEQYGVRRREFRQAVVFAPEAKSDFNGDGKSDILWDNGAGSRWAYTMNGALVQSSTAMPGAAPGWVLAGIGDFNGDGKADLLWKNSASPTQFWVYIMNGAR